MPRFARLPHVVRNALFCAVFGTLALGFGAGCSDPPPEGPAPMPGAKPGTQRWVVHLVGDAPDLVAYRAARGKGEGVETAEDALRKAARDRAKPLRQSLKGLDGKIVDYWWMTNAVTVEVPEGAVGTLKGLDGVDRIVPDQLLE